MAQLTNLGSFEVIDLYEGIKTVEEQKRTQTRICGEFEVEIEYNWKDEESISLYLNKYENGDKLTKYVGSVHTNAMLGGYSHLIQSLDTEIKLAKN